MKPRFFCFLSVLVFLPLGPAWSLDVTNKPLPAPENSPRVEYQRSRPQPNIVHVLTDDLGWQDIAAYYRAIHGEEPTYETPHMDRVAQQGMRLMQAYSPAPTCAPSRAAYMSGQYTPHTGVLHVMGGRLARPYHESHALLDPFYSGRLDINTPIIADVLKEAGYVTAHIQKWHFGGRSKGFPGPLDYGFDFSWSWKGLHYNDVDLYDPNNKKTADYEGIWRPMRPDRITGFASSYDPSAPYALDPNDDDRPFDSVVDLSVRWMDKAKDQGKPFFMNFCPSFVHGPFSTRDRKRLAHYCEKMDVPFPTDPGRIADMEPGQTNPYYAAMLDSLDWQVGKILQFLENTEDPRNPGHNLIDNTFLMVSSDNGGLEASPISNGKDKGGRERITDNTPLRGGKLKIFEGGIRIPFIIQGPGIQAGSVSETPITLIDLFPTYMAMAAMESPLNLDVDGCNLLPLLRGDDHVVRFENGAVRDTLFWHYPSVMPSSSVIRKGGWKLRLNHAPEVNGLPRVMLHNLYNEDGSVADLGETNNLADAEPEKTKMLLRELEAWLTKYDAELPYKNAEVRGKTLAGMDKVPAVIKRSHQGAEVAVHVETGPGKSKVMEGKLVYTTNGSRLLRDHKHMEEWDEVPATVRDGVVTATAPPGMTHGVFYLRDEHGFLITSEPLVPIVGPGGNSGAVGVELLKEGYAYHPGLVSLIDCARSAETNALKTGQDVAVLQKAIDQAVTRVTQPVDEPSYSLSMRQLRNAIGALDVPEASLPVLNQFQTDAW